MVSTREGAKIKTTKVSSEGLTCNSAKFCTMRKFPAIRYIMSANTTQFRKREISLSRCGADASIDSPKVVSSTVERILSTSIKQRNKGHVI